MSNQEWRYAFGMRMYEARIAKGLSQRHLGKLVGVHPNTISTYEMGTHEPTAHVLKRICDSLDVDADVLLGRRDT